MLENSVIAPILVLVQAAMNKNYRVDTNRQQ
jgi:hypothetical protein